MYPDFLEIPYTLTPEQVAFYQQNNYIKLKDVLDAASLAFFQDHITQVVLELQQKLPDLNARDTYGKAFLQAFNLWRKNPSVVPLVFSKRLAQIATELMQCSGVRLYHDQALFKEAGGGITPWHADQYYWPLSNSNTVTAWIPLTAIPLEMGPLEFSAGSQAIVEGRELSISDESEKEISKNLKINDFEHVVEPYDLGEVSFHSGWIFHRAGANLSNQMRKVMTIIYMDESMSAVEPSNENQANDLATWCPGVKPGDTINSELNPVLFTHGN
jgi:ectoine hydroxylase-related dioxygenase (phytanoyl-CoA dioxygenase family)